MTIKQKLFIKKYLEYRNATKAVLEIYEVKNTNSAAVIGYNLLRNINVRRELERITEAKESIPSRIVTMMDNVMTVGSTREQLKMTQVVLKLYGLL